MPITDLTSLIPASQIDPAMATDVEAADLASSAALAAIANHVAATAAHPAYETQLTRSGSGAAVDANSIIAANSKKPLAIIWIDSGGSYVNFPTGFAGNGMLIQLDALTYTAQQGNNYRIQFLSQLISGQGSILYYRTQSGAWNPWVKLA